MNNNVLRRREDGTYPPRSEADNPDAPVTWVDAYGMDRKAPNLDKMHARVGDIYGIDGNVAVFEESFPWTASVRNENGTHDITGDLAKLYDALLSSMDWGSDMLSIEEAEACLRIGRLCGFREDEYTTECGHFALIGTDGRWLSDPTHIGQHYSYSNGSAQWTVSTKEGKRLTVKDVTVKEDGVVAAVLLVRLAPHEGSAMERRWVPRELVQMDHPREVWASEKATFSTPVTS